MSNLDEIVVGQSNTDFLIRIEEELKKANEQELEDSNKTLEERVKSKNWKTRKNAYTEILNNLTLAVSREDKIFLDYVNLYSIIIDDPHGSAQESALDVIKLLFENYEYASNLVPEIFKNILEKCYTSSRAILKQKAKDLLVLSLEVSNEVTGVFEALKSALENKNSKIQIASLNLLTYLLSQFGSFKIEFRLIIQFIEKLCDNSNPQIRTEALEFYKELYKWIKDSIKPYVQKLKEAQQKDLEKAFDEIKSKNLNVYPSKFLKSDKNKNNSKETNEANIKMLLLKEEENFFNNTEGIELFNDKFNEAWSEDLTSKEKKWNEKKDMLESFIQSSNGVKIKNSGRAHIVVAFTKLLKDSNINVVNSAINAISNLAKGLRKDFLEAKDFLLLMIEKLKEKKEKLVTDVFSCLDSLMTHCLSLDEVIDDLNAFIFNDKDKSITTQTKERFCKFIEKTILKTYKTVLSKIGKTLADSMFKLSDDPSPDVRNAALTTIGIIKFRIGEMRISKILNELCDIKKKKVDEASKSVEVDPIYENEEKASNKTIVNNKKQTSNNFNKVENTKNQINDVEMTDLSNDNLENSFKINKKAVLITNDIEMAPISNPPPRSLSSNPPNKVKVVTQKPAQVAKSNTNMDVDLEANEDEANLTNDDIEAIMKEKLGNEIMINFNDTKWENRKTSFISLDKYILENNEDSNRSIDIILRFVKLKLKDYKENNFNIIKEALTVIQNLCEKCSNFSKKHCIIIIKKTCEKIGDIKLKANIFNLYQKFMEYHGPKYITNVLLKHMTNNVKGPNILKEFSLFMEKTIEDFGISTLPVKEIIDFAKFLANNANPQLRNSATSLICMNYKYIGPNIKKFLNDIKEATLKVIEAEMEKVTVVTHNTNKRELKGQAASENNNQTGNIIENLFPRTDISKKITTKIIKDLNEGKWQEKKVTLDLLEKIFVEANMRIMPNGLNELITSLKNKLDDGNKNMVRNLIQFITKMVEALGSNCKLFAKTLINPILRNLSDKMNMLRDDVIKCLEKWSEQIGFENVLVFCPASLVVDNFELRTDLLKLIIKNKATLPKFDCKELVPGILSCLLDKTPSIRILAEELAKEVLKYISINNFYSAMKDYKPAIANTIKSIIEKYASLICVEPVLNDENVEFKQPVEKIVVNNLIQKKAEKEKLTIPVVKDNNLNTSLGNANQTKVVKNKRDSSSESDSKNKNKKPLIPVKNALPNIKTIPNTENATVASGQIVIKNSIPLLTNLTIKINQKNRRLENEKHLTLPNDYFTQEYDAKLKECMIQFISKNWVDYAYSNDVTKYNSLFTNITNTMKTDSHTFIEVTDLWFKWILIRNFEMNNNHFFNNIVFDFLKNIIEFLEQNECCLHENENKIIVEILICKFFTLNPQTKNKAKTYFADFCSKKLLKFDLIIEIISSKFNSLMDLTLKLELLDLLSSISAAFKFTLDSVDKFSLFTNIFDSISISTTDEKIKKTVIDLIKEFYMKFDISNKKRINQHLQKNELQCIIDKSSIEEPAYTLSNINYHNKNQDLNNLIIPPTSNISSNSYNLSTSPLYSLKKFKNRMEESSKESVNLKLFNCIDQDKIDSMLNNLYSSNLNDKIKLLLEFNDIITNRFNESVIVLEKNIDEIIKAFTDLLKSIFLQVLNPDLLEVLKHLLTVFYKTAMTKDVIENCNDETIFSCFEEILRGMLYENLETVEYQEEDGKKIIKYLQSLMFKLMENFKPSGCFIGFIRLLIKYRVDNSRICNMSIKCILKLTNIMPNIIGLLEIDRILIAIYDYIIEFERSVPDLNPTNQIEEMSLKILRSIINEIIKIKNDNIWNYYKAGIEANNLPDKHLRKWIQLIIRSKNGISMPNIGSAGLPNLSGISLNYSNASTLMTTETRNVHDELNFYIAKINKSNSDQNTNEKMIIEVIAILKRNNLQLDYLVDKMCEADYKNAVRISKGLNSEPPSFSRSEGNSSKHQINKIPNKFISNFSVEQNERNIKNVPENINSNPLSNSIQNISINTGANVNTINTQNTTTYPPVYQIKTLQEYRNKFHGLSERSDNKNKTSPSPIKTNNNIDFKVDSLSNDNKKNIANDIETFLKNKDMLKAKRDQLSEARNTEEPNTNAFDKLLEMKKKLELLRSQKF